MSKLDQKTLAKAISLGQNLGHKIIYVKLSNGQMYSKKNVAMYGQTEKEFNKNFEVVEVPDKEEKKPAEAPKKEKKPAEAPKDSGSGDDKEVKKKLRAEYKKLTGSNPFNGFSIDQLKAKIEELKKAKESDEGGSEDKGSDKKETNEPQS